MRCSVGIIVLDLYSSVSEKVSKRAEIPFMKVNGKSGVNMKIAVNRVQWNQNVRPENAAVAEAFSSLDHVFELDGPLVSHGRFCHVIKVHVGDHNYFVKRYHPQGKHLRKVFGRSRPNNEQRNYAYFARMGIPVPQVVAYGSQRMLGLFLRGAIVTEEIPQAMDLQTLMRARPDLLHNQTWLLHLLRLLAESVRRIHEDHFTHGDLKWRNILATTEEMPRIFFLDCPNGSHKSCLWHRHSLIKDLANLDRLGEPCLSRTVRLRFYLWYRNQTRLTQKDKRLITKIVASRRRAPTYLQRLVEPMAHEIQMNQHENDHILDSVAPLLGCPECHGDLVRQGTGLTCLICSRAYELQDGIPLLARIGSSELWGGASDGLNSTAYQEQFQGSNIGQRYQQRYGRRWYKRCVTRREMRRIERLLASQPRCRRLLDIPCGGGRVSGPLAAATDLLLQADVSLGQVLTARQIMGSQGHVAWFTASAFMIPLKDGAVDAAICNRLTHHLPSLTELERLIQELLRVSTRFVILSYYDHNSFKSLGRRLRGKHPGNTLRRKDLLGLAERHGARVQTDVPLWCAGSRLRYALLQKCSG